MDDERQFEIDPDLYLRASMKARLYGESLDDVVVRALREYLGPEDPAAAE